MEIAIVAMSTTIYTVLGTLAAGFYIVPGVTVFYLPEAFIMAASMWFGVWGCLGAFFGSILFGPFVGIGYLIGLEFGLPNMSSSIVAGLVLRKLRMDLSLKDKKSLALWLLFAAGLGPLVEAVVGLPVYVFNGWYTWEFAYTWGLAVWLIGDVTAVAVVGTILMRVLSKYMIKTALFHKGFIHREIVTEH
jgi:integral membrane sensor domain MASE1